MEFTLNIFNFRSTENVTELKLEDALKGLYILHKKIQDCWSISK